MYKLTVAVLTYNRANMLKEMLDSILQQTYKDFYVIIYDNCSEDNTPETVEPYLSDERFTYHRHAVSVHNANYALNNCNTEYLLIVHDDDIMLPDMVRREISILDSYEDISIVSTNTNYIDINSNITKYSVCSDAMNNKDCMINSKEYINLLINKSNVIAFPTVMFRMSIIKANNLSFLSEIGGASDCYFWLELNQLDYEFYYINTALYHYRIHNLQDSRNSLLLFPLLRKPVYNLLVKNNYSKHIIKSWLKRIEKYTLDEICNQKNRREAFKSIREKILFQDMRDLVFLINIFNALYMPGFIIRKIKKIIKKLLFIK